MITVERPDWSSVTLAEYDALAIIRRPDAIEHMNAYWDDIADYDLCNVTGKPNRLSADGVAWLAALNTTAMSTLDECELIRMARDFVTSMGTMLTVNVARSIRDRA